MSRLARGLSLGVFIACLISIVTASVLFYADRDDIPSGRIVVVGDPETPEMREAVDDLRTRVDDGESLGADQGNEIVVVILLVFLVVVWVGIGVLIVWRQPTNWAGWLFILTGAPLPLLSLAQATMVHGLKVRPGSVPLIGFWATAGEFALYPIALLPLLFLLYPDGRLPDRRWRWSAIGLAGGTAVALIGFLLRPGPFNNWRDDGILYANPFGVDGLAAAADVIITVGTVTALAAAFSTVLAVRWRFKRSTGETRQQMRWLVLVASIAGALLLIQFLVGIVGTILGIEEGDLPGGAELLFTLPFGLMVFTIVVGVPAAYLVAMFRYRLWDLDLVIKKTVIFGVVAGAITLLVLAGLVLVPAAVLGTGLTGWERGLLLVGVGIGLLFGPLRRRARHVADRVVYGKRATPYEVLTAFSERVGEAYATQDVLPRMASVLANGTGATTARVLLRVGSGVREVARWPEDAEVASGEHVFPVIDSGEELGALGVSMPANDPMDPSKERLVRDLASQAGLVLRNVGLIEELRASRQRLVAAQDEERRRIERNIHDGAQQQLVALAVKLRLAEQLAEKDAERTQTMLGDLREEANDALENLRDLARGIFPPLLADKGLAEALQAQARKSSVPVTVEPDGVGRYPQEAEAAVYFCVLEALQNAAKYSSASEVLVTLGEDDGDLVFVVHDDGIGFEPSAAGGGTGLQGMADRLDAIGGALRVESAPGRGTTVTGRVPAGATG